MGKDNEVRDRNQWYHDHSPALESLEKEFTNEFSRLAKKWGESELRPC